MLSYIKYDKNMRFQHRNSFFAKIVVRISAYILFARIYTTYLFSNDIVSFKLIDSNHTIQDCTYSCTRVFYLN